MQRCQSNSSHWCLCSPSGPALRPGLRLVSSWEVQLGYADRRPRRPAQGPGLAQSGPLGREESRERPAHFPRGLGSERVGLGRQAAEGALFRAPQSLPPAGELRASLEDIAGGSGSHCGVPLRLKASPGCVPSTWRRGQAGRALL